MPKYIVEVSGSWYAYTTYNVEAKTEDDASEEAIKLFCEDDHTQRMAFEDAEVDSVKEDEEATSPEQQQREKAIGHLEQERIAAARRLQADAIRGGVRDTTHDAS